MTSGSQLFDVYQSDPERAIAEGSERLLQGTPDETTVREIEDVFGQFLKERKRFSESAAVRTFDALIDGLLAVCSTHPSPEAARALSLLLDFLCSGTCTAAAARCSFGQSHGPGMPTGDITGERPGGHVGVY